jgi:hypothetical protein
MPGWLLLIVTLGVLLLYPDTFLLIAAAWTLGLWVFLPFAWSFIERLRELQTLPSASVLEKLRRRSLVFDRMYTGLILAVIVFAWFLISAMLNRDQDFSERALPYILLAFYSVAAFNVWRVHQPKFAKRPRSLWPWIDGDQVDYLNPL